MGSDDHCTLVFIDIDGTSHTVAISNAAIAQFLRLPSGTNLMVEECSDFTAAYRDRIMAAAQKSLRGRGTVDGRIVLVAKDL
jgi:hypothetical protein